MGVTTFLMGRVKWEDTGDASLLEMKSRIDTMIFEFEKSRLTPSGQLFIFRFWAQRELGKLWPLKARFDAEVARRGLTPVLDD
jgi:hypothetical protein